MPIFDEILASDTLTDGKAKINNNFTKLSNVPLKGFGIITVSLLPTLPNADYPVNTIVYNSADGKLYKNVSDVWNAVVSAGDLSGQIGTGQIADAAVSTSKLTAGAVTADKILAGTITAAQIASGTITGDRIDANTITGSNIDAGTITGDKIAGTTITGANIAGTTITGDKIAGTTITGDKIAAGTITATNIDTSTLTISDFAGNANNLCGNSMFLSGDTTGWTFPSGCSVVADSNFASGYAYQDAYRDKYYGSQMDVVPGETYFFSFRGYRSNSNTSYNLNIGFQLKKADGTTSWSTAATITSATTSVTQASGYITIPSDYVQATIWVQNTAPSGAVSPTQYHWGDVVVRRSQVGDDMGTTKLAPDGVETYDGSSNLSVKMGDISGLPSVPSGTQYGFWGKLGSGIHIEGLETTIVYIDTYYPVVLNVPSNKTYSPPAATETSSWATVSGLSIPVAGGSTLSAGYISTGGVNDVLPMHISYQVEVYVDGAWRSLINGSTYSPSSNTTITATRVKVTITFLVAASWTATAGQHLVTVYGLLQLYQQT